VPKKNDADNILMFSHSKKCLNWTLIKSDASHTLINQNHKGFVHVTEQLKGR
jgi:hypothetical protein